MRMGVVLPGLGGVRARTEGGGSTFGGILQGVHVIHNDVPERYHRSGNIREPLSGFHGMPVCATFR